MINKSKSISDILIAFLCSARSSRRFYEIIREREFSRHNKNSIKVGLSRLNKAGYVKNSSTGWLITKKGFTRATHINLFTYIVSPFKKDSSRNTLVSFDIKEEDRKLRAWLRNQLKIFGYKMLQQSLWFGPGPLPTAFKDKIDEFGIKENVKIFSIIKKQK